MQGLEELEANQPSPLLLGAKGGEEKAACSAVWIKAQT